MTDVDQALAVAQRTYNQLEGRGWCVWRLDKLDGMEICLVRGDNIMNVPAGYPVFNVKEIILLFEDSGPGLEGFKFLCAIKEITPVVVEGVSAQRSLDL